MNQRVSRRGAWTAAVLVVLGTAFLALAAADPAWAQGAPGGPKHYTAFQIWVIAGGGFGFVQVATLIGMSIATFALIIEHGITLRRDKLVPPDVIVELEQLLEEEQYEEAMNLCESSRNYITNVVAAALAKMSDGYDAMVGALDTEIELENLKLMQKISWLTLLSSIGPLIGLFGTVFGMVGVFTEIAQKPQVTPAEMAGGIYTALVTTVWGLIVAIPAITGYFWFRNRLQRMTFELASLAAELLDRFKPAAGGAK